MNLSTVDIPCDDSRDVGQRPMGLRVMVYNHHQLLFAPGDAYSLFLNGGQFFYSFICLLISSLGLIFTQKFFSILHMLMAKKGNFTWI